MRIRLSDAEYVLAVINGITAGTVPVQYLTSTCPMCGQFQTYFQNDGHVVVPDDEDDQDSPVAVVIACQGFRVVDPATVGIDQDTWQEWLLVWESAGTDEPGDQDAESNHLIEGATSAHYSTGPTHDGRWSLELTQRRDGAEIDVMTWEPLSSEEEAKAVAQTLECQQDLGL